MATLSQNVKQAIHDFDTIKDAIEYKGVDVPTGTPTSEYDQKIREIQTGTSDYNDLNNKPSINDVELEGNKSASELGLQKELLAGANINIEESGEISVDLTDTMKLTVVGPTEEEISDLPEGQLFKPSGVNNFVYALGVKFQDSSYLVYSSKWIDLYCAINHYVQGNNPPAYKTADSEVHVGHTWNHKYIMTKCRYEPYDDVPYKCKWQAITYNIIGLSSLPTTGSLRRTYYRPGVLEYQYPNVLEGDIAKIYNTNTGSFDYYQCTELVINGGTYTYSWIQIYQDCYTKTEIDELESHKADIESGQITDNNIAWYTSESDGFRIYGEYTLLGDMCFLRAQADLVWYSDSPNWERVYYTLPVAALSSSTAIGLCGNEAYSIATNTQQDISVLEIRQLGSQYITHGGVVYFTLSYKFK